MLLGYWFINDDGRTIYAMLLIQAARKLNQREPNFPATDLFGKERVRTRFDIEGEKVLRNSPPIKATFELKREADASP